MLERSQILAEDHLITLDDLPETIAEGAPASDKADVNPDHLSEVERRHVHEVLRREKGNILLCSLPT